MRQRYIGPSPSETRTLNAMIQAYGNRKRAAELINRKDYTIKNNMKVLCEKLEVDNQFGAIVRAIQLGLFEITRESG